MQLMVILRYNRKTLSASQLVVARIVLLARHVVLALALLDLGPLQAGHVPQGARWCSGEVLLVLAKGLVLIGVRCLKRTVILGDTDLWRYFVFP